MLAEQVCYREDEKHASHRWGEDHGDMGTIWYECPGVGYW